MMGESEFFGYGSLVNRRTHSYGGCQPATLTGWRRVWVSSTRRNRSFLSIEPHAGATVQGLVAEVPNADWTALDDREFAYFRSPVTTRLLGETALSDRPAQLYQARAELIDSAPRKKPILLSYLDVVIQGYLEQFGTEGVAAFLETTAGWDAPVQNDRDAPIYGLHQRLTAAETALVDRCLADLSAQVE